MSDGFIPLEQRMAMRQDYIGAMSGRLRAGRDFSSGPPLALAAGAVEVPFAVQYRGNVFRILIADTGKRPPDPDGVWLDELLSAACRCHFGAGKGSCRKVQGTDNYEFREFWEEPTRYKVVERVRCEVIDATGAVVKNEDIKIDTTAYPGADVRSVVFASAIRLCQQKFGVGMMEWVPGKDHKVRYTAGKKPTMDRFVEAQYTIHRKGGISNVITIHLSPEQSRDWGAIKWAVESECHKKYGTGRVTYMPELGEVCFGFQ